MTGDKPSADQPAPTTNGARAESGLFRRGVWRAGALVLVFTLAYAVCWGEPARRAVLGDALFWVGSSLAAACLFGAAASCRRHAPRQYRAWLILAIGQTCFALGDVTWGVIAVLLRRSPFPSAADVFYLLFYGFFVVGLLQLPRRALSRAERLRMMLDMAIVMGGALIVFWVLLLDPYLGQDQTSRLVAGVTLVYVTLNLAMLFPLFLLLLSRVGLNGQRQMFLLTLGGLLRVGLEALLGWKRLHGLSTSGGVEDIGWMASYALVGLAALAQIEDNRAGQGELRPAAKPYGAAFWTLFVPLGWVLAAYAVVVTLHPNQDPNKWYWMDAGAAILFGLVATRQLAVIGENRRLFAAAERELAERRQIEAELRRANEALDERVRARTAELAKANASLVAQITEQERTATALRESESLYRALIETTATGFVILDSDGRVVDANAEYARLAGYDSVAALQGRSATDWTAPHDKERNAAGIQELLARGQARNVELDYISPAGKITPIEINTTVLRTPAGIRILGLCRDITQRRAAAAAVLDSREQYRALFNGITDAVFVHYLEDNPTPFLAVNDVACRRLGYSREELLRRTIRDIDAPESPADVSAATATLRAGRDLLFEQVHLAKDGHRIPVEVHAQSFMYGGRPAVLSVVRDITERRRAEEERQRLEAQMQQAQKLESLGLMAGGIAHDFNNLLTTVLGNSELAREELPPTSPARERLAAIGRAAQRAAELCQQMLAYAGRSRLAVRAVDLNELLDQMGRMFEVTISKQVTIRRELAPNLPAVRADGTQLRQVVMNLVLNAAEAIGDRPGTLTLRTGVRTCDSAYLESMWLNERLPAGDYVFFEVVDTGCGMDQETLARIFDPFFTTKFTGRGLGLAAVLGIVRGHKGAIRVTSEPDHGTAFRILLPLVPAPGAAATPAQPAPAPWRGSGTVLLVDDEEAVRAVGCEMLERLGFEVLTAGDGIEAVETYRRYRDCIGVVLLDLMMPRQGGEQTLRELRQVAPAVRVVVCSGFGDLEVARRLTGANGVGFLAKPYDQQSLTACLQQMLGA